MKLDVNDRKLLNLIQADFPLTIEPYRKLGETLGIDEGEVIARIKQLEENGLIRRLGGIFDSRKLGYSGVLCAMKAPGDRINEVSTVVNSFPGVTHNYLREYTFNMWFTVLAQSKEKLDGILNQIRSRAGIEEMLVLPAERVFKIKVNFDLDPVNVMPQQIPAPLFEAQPAMKIDPLFSEQEKKVIRELQNGLPLVPRPFKTMAEKLDMAEEELTGMIKGFIEKGQIRRFGAALRHYDLGYAANAMVVWDVPEEGLLKAGREIAAYREVSHCYQRPRRTGWPYNLFAVVHGRTREECIQIVEKISLATRLKGYRLLFSTTELKKSSMRYFEEE